MADATKKMESTVGYVQNDGRLSIMRVLAEVESFNHSDWMLVDWKDDTLDGGPAVTLKFEK